MQPSRTPAPYISFSALVKLELLCLVVIALILLLASAPAFPQKLSALDAKDHVGETATVCGKVVSTRYAASTKGQPTFINLDKAYPGQIFTIVIWGENRAKSGKPDLDYKDKRVCVTGRITAYRGMPEIAVNDPRQVRTEN